VSAIGVLFAAVMDALHRRSRFLPPHGKEFVGSGMTATQAQVSIMPVSFVPS